MMYRPLPPLCFIPVLALALGIGLTRVAAAADPPMPIQVANAGELAPVAGSFVATTKAPDGKPQLVFQPAPMPDPDMDAPQGATAAGASLEPALFRHKEEFDGDGYAGSSNADHGQDKRRTPAAGLNWSVPLK